MGTYASGGAYAALLRAHVVRGSKATRPVALAAAVVPRLRKRVARAANPRREAESVVPLPSGSAAERVGVGYSAPSVVRVVLGNSVYFVVQERWRGQDRRGGGSPRRAAESVVCLRAVMQPRASEMGTTLRESS